MVHVIRNVEKPDWELIKKYENLSTATIHEAMNRSGAVSSYIKPIARGMRVCGPAVTVSFPAGDNLMLHKAIAVAGEGDVIVAAQEEESDIQAGGWGDINSLAAAVRGIKGLVIDGYIRDSKEIIAMGFPVFARGISIRGTLKNKLGQINHPLSFGSIIVHPGDIVLGDDDGLVVVPRTAAEDVLKETYKREAKEQEIKRKLRQGHLTLELLGLDKVLEEKGLTEE